MILPETLFPEPPLCAFRHDTNICDLLVHSTLSDNTSTSGSTTSCKRSRCNTCAHVTTMDSITGPNNYTFQIRHHFTCTSTNVVNAIICTTFNDSKHFYIAIITTTVSSIDAIYRYIKDPVSNLMKKKTLKKIINLGNLYFDCIIDLAVYTNV